jgi:hypothetical protein
MGEPAVTSLAPRRGDLGVAEDLLDDPDLRSLLSSSVPAVWRATAALFASTSSRGEAARTGTGDEHWKVRRSRLDSTAPSTAQIAEPQAAH